MSRARFRSPCHAKAEGPRRHHCSPSHADLVEGYTLAVEAQRARAEAYSHGYRTELEEFYRDVEARLTFRAWLEGARDTTREEWAA